MAAVRVTGLRELERAFGRADKEVRRDMKDALEEAAQPVRRDAQALAVGVTLRANDPWNRMRVGSYRSVAYVAPVERGTGNSTPATRAFADRLLGRAMIPALERNVHQVERRVEHLLDEVANVWERT
jgi:hypothetical protein